jgi:PBSX family phage terminase large subunit
VIPAPSAARVEVAFQPFPKQYQFLTTSKNFAAFIGGIGSGKTFTGAHRGVMAAFGQIGNKAIVVPNTGMVVAPTFPMVDDILVPTYEAILGYEEQGGLIRKYNRSKHVMTLINGSVILFRSAEHPERLRGPNLAWIHIDEAALLAEDVWKILIGRIRQGGELGFIWLTTTPKGRNWIWQKFFKSRRARFFGIQMATRENKALSSDFVDELESEYAGDFAAQELEGAFVAFEGLIYAEFDEMSHVWYPSKVEPQNYAYTVAGVDWGFASPGVMLVAGVDADGRVDVLHEEYVARRPIEDWAEVAAQLRNIYQVQTFYCDPSKPDYIQKLVDKGVDAVGADNTVETGISEVRKLLIQRGQRGVPHLRVNSRAQWLRSEFSQYVWMKRRIAGEGDVTLDVPKKAKDHALDALRYLVMGVRDIQGYVPLQVGMRKYA